MASCIGMVEALRFHAPATAARQAALAELLDGGRPLTAIIPGVAGELAVGVVRESPGIGGETEVRPACERLWWCFAVDSAGQ